MIEYRTISKDGGRFHNEDYVGVEQKGMLYCFVLADGLGGHGGGAEASQFVTETILRDFKERGEVSKEYLKQCFETAQEALLKTQKDRGCPDEMKTTLVVLLIDEEKILWGHIGDSRLYYFQNRKYRVRTLDHSVPQMLVMAGEITEKEIRGHADRNRLLRVMGTEWDSPKYQIAEFMETGQKMAFLLCSDGFWELIEEKTMQTMLKKSETPENWLDNMEKEVLKNGKGKEMDNYSAVAVFVNM